MSNTLHIVTLCTLLALPVYGQARDGERGATSTGTLEVSLVVDNIDTRDMPQYCPQLAGVTADGQPITELVLVPVGAECNRDEAALIEYYNFEFHYGGMADE